MTGTDQTTAEGRDTRARIEQTALLLFRTKGYAGASIREIAAGAGIAIATMFWHFNTKSAILESLLHRIVDQQREEINDALEGVVDPEDRLRAFVSAVVVAHCLRGDESFVAESELRSLEPEAQAAVREKRLAIQHDLRQIIIDGIATRRFAAADPATAAIAILTMCTSVAAWYRPNRTMGPLKLAEAYCTYSINIVTTAG